MAVRPRGILIATAIAALVVFAVVQDRVTAAGARRYVSLQRAALAGRARAVTVDEIMRPAIARSVRQGLFWGGVVLIGGVGFAAIVAARGVADRRDEEARTAGNPQSLVPSTHASDPGAQFPDTGTGQP